jgi:hypothetical protein
MTEGTIHLALFNELDPATEAIARLRELGIPDTNMNILSGVPYSDKMLGRPPSRSLVPWFSVAGFLVGFLISLALNFGTPLMYPIHVGGMPIISVPTSLVMMFEISMLGMMVFTFLGVLWESNFPAYGKRVYHPDVSNGKIGVEFICPPEIHTQAHELLADLGADWVHKTEGKVL